VSVWDVAGPLCLVIGGFIGLVGLVRVLTLSRRERPKSHRFFTIGMVAVGLVTLLVFHQPDLSDLISLAGVVFLVLPFTGAARLLRKSWKFLVAGR
jgi:cell division protein FtsW (lipid II flippase)